MQRSQAEYEDLVEIINILMKVPSLRDGVRRHAIELHGAWVTAQIAQGFEQVGTPSSLAVVDEIWALGYLSQKLKCDAAALSKAQKIDKGTFCHVLMFLANSSAGLKLPEQSKYSFVLTYAFDKRIDECKRLDLLQRKKLLCSRATVLRLSRTSATPLFGAKARRPSMRRNLYTTPRATLWIFLPTTTSTTHTRSRTIGLIWGR
jgi:hypothetical protein